MNPNGVLIKKNTVLVEPSQWKEMLRMQLEGFPLPSEFFGRITISCEHGRAVRVEISETLKL